MVAQKWKKKNLLAKIFCIFQHLLTQNPTNQGSSLSWSFQTIWLLENPKTEGSRELFLPENDFKTCYTLNFIKKHPDSGGLETNQRPGSQTLIFFHMSFHIWTQYNIKIVLVT